MIKSVNRCLNCENLVGSLKCAKHDVDVEIDNDGYKLEIKENNENLMVIERDNPFISIRIEKKTSKLNVNFKNHIQNIECSKHVFKM